MSEPRWDRRKKFFAIYGFYSKGIKIEMENMILRAWTLGIVV